MPDIGFGTQLQAESSAGSSNFVAIANVHDFTGPSLSRDDVETTVYNSADRYREYIPGLKEAGEVVASLNLVSTDSSLQNLWHSTEAQSTAGPASSTNAFIGSFESTTTRIWRLVGPNTDAWTFTAYVKGLVQAQPVGDRRTWEATFKITGRPILAHSAATT